MFSLKEMFDKKVVVSLDPSWNCPWPNIDCRRKGSPSLPSKSELDKLWCYEIVGKRGKIYPQSETRVCVSTTPRIGRKLQNIFKSEAEFKRRGDWEYELTIPLHLIESTFRYIKPHKRRIVTQEQAKLLTERLKRGVESHKKGGLLS